MIMMMSEILYDFIMDKHEYDYHYSFLFFDVSVPLIPYVIIFCTIKETKYTCPVK